MNQTKIDTLFKAQTQKMTPYARETKAQNSFVFITARRRGGGGEVFSRHSATKRVSAKPFQTFEVLIISRFLSEEYKRFGSRDQNVIQNILPH